MAKLIYVEVLNRYTGEENGEGQNSAEKTKSPLLVNIYKSSIIKETKKLVSPFTYVLCSGSNAFIAPFFRKTYICRSVEQIYR